MGTGGTSDSAVETVRLPRLVHVSAQPPFERFNPTLGPQPIKWNSSEGILEPTFVGGHRLVSVACTPAQYRQGLGVAVAALAFKNHHSEVRRSDLQGLISHLPGSPVHPNRIPTLRSRGFTNRQIREAASKAFLTAPWNDELWAGGDGEGQGAVTIRLDQLPAYLNRQGFERLAGPGLEARRERKAQQRFESELARSQRRRRSFADSEALLDIRRRAVEAKAETLTEAQRAVYLLVERDNLTPKEAGQELGISAAAARNRLKRARKSLAS